MQWNLCNFGVFEWPYESAVHKRDFSIWWLDDVWINAGSEILAGSFLLRLVFTAHSQLFGGSCEVLRCGMERTLEDHKGVGRVGVDGRFLHPPSPTGF